MNRKTILILISAVLFLVLLLVSLKRFYSPEEIFYRKFGFKLPKSAKIENYDYAILGEKTLTMKVSFSDEEYDKIEKGLDDYLTTDEKLKSRLANSVWPGLSEDESILVVGHAFLKGKRVMTREVLVIVTMNEREEHFLYVKH